MILLFHHYVGVVISKVLTDMTWFVLSLDTDLCRLSLSRAGAVQVNQNAGMFDCHLVCCGLVSSITLK